MRTSDGRELVVVVKDPEDSATGLLELHLYLDEERVGRLFAEPREDRVMWLQVLEVAPELRGQGLGAFLLRRFEEAAAELWFRSVRGRLSPLDDATPSEEDCAARAAWLTRRGFTCRPDGPEWDVEKGLE